MTIAAFPTTLPAPNDDSSYTVKPANNILRTSFDAGVPKQRRQFTAVVSAVNCTLELTQAQVSTLDDFYNNTVGNALQFSWIDFRTGNTKNFRFVDAPSYTPKPNAVNIYNASLTLEMMP